MIIFGCDIKTLSDVKATVDKKMVANQNQFASKKFVQKEIIKNKNPLFDIEPEYQKTKLAFRDGFKNPCSPKNISPYPTPHAGVALIELDLHANEGWQPSIREHLK